jgi:predicted RNA binding protein YcfA (HicA-like mRNA interferase family)
VKIIEDDARFAGWRDSGSSHRIARFEGGVTVPIPVHGNKDMPIGTKLSIIRVLKAGGLCAILWIVASFLLPLVGG